MQTRNINEEILERGQMIAVNRYGTTVITNMEAVDLFDYEEDLESLTEENFNNILNNNNE